MDPINYSLIFLGGAICLCALVWVVVGYRIVSAKSLPVRLLNWLAAGLLCFCGSQIVGKGVIGWWPFLGTPDVFVHLVKVEVSPRSGKIAAMAFAGFKGQASQSAAKLFVADRDGKDIAEVCGGAVMDIRWSGDGEHLYVLRSGAGRRGHPPKSLWLYTPSAKRLACVRELPRTTTALSLDPEEKNLLFLGPLLVEGERRFLLVRGKLDSEKQDRAVCWREGWQGAHAWGPRTGDIFFATNEESSFSDSCGLWVIRGSELSQPAILVQMQGIEGIWLNPSETHAALFVRRFPPPCLDFDLYVLDLAERLAKPIAANVEWGSAAWDHDGKRLAFADESALMTYDVSTGRARLLIEAPPNWVHPKLRERLKPLSYSSSGDIVFQAGLWRVERYDDKSGEARTLFHAGQLRRYFSAGSRERAGKALREARSRGIART